MQSQIPCTAEALGNYRASLEIRQRLAHAEPNDIRRRRDLASAYDRIGDALTAQGNLTEALSSYKESRRIAELITPTGDKSESQRDLAVVMDKIGDTERARGMPDTAVFVIGGFTRPDPMPNVR